MFRCLRRRSSGLRRAWFAISPFHLKNKLGWDDALDVWGVHGIGGALGVVLLGVFASKAMNAAGADGLLAGGTHFFLVQCLAVIGAALYAFLFTYVMLAVINLFTTVRVSEADEDLGLDASVHGEQRLRFRRACRQSGQCPGEPVRLGLARRRVLGELQQGPVVAIADGEAIAGPEREPVDPEQRQVLAVGPGERLVPVRPDALDGLLGVQADRRPLAAMDVLAVAIPVEAEPQDSCAGDRRLRDAALVEVHRHHRPFGARHGERRRKRRT